MAQPDIAGKDLANPSAMLLSFAMMLRYSFNLSDQAILVEQAVENVMKNGKRTGDIMAVGCQQVGTEGFGEAVWGKWISWRG